MTRTEQFAFFREDSGQDLTEYALLLAFVCLACAAIFIMSGNTFVGIWTSANSTLANGNAAAAS